MRTLKRGFLGLVVLLGLSSCGNTPSPRSQPPYACLSESAVSYASREGVPFLSVSHMDLSEGCFTVEERDFLDLLAYAYDHHYASAASLEEIVEAFPTIGPATVNALAFSLIGFENDRAALSAGGGNPDDLGPFSVSMIGIFPVHDNRFVKELRVKGKTYHAPVLLEHFGLPSRYALPENNPDIIPASAYPPFPEVEVPGIPDWANETDGVIVNALTLLGCDACTISEDARLTSYDLSLHRGFWIDDAGYAHYEVKDRRVWVTTLSDAIVDAIFEDPFLSLSDEDRRAGIVPHMSFNIHLRQRIDPRDAPLYGARDISEIVYSYVHVVPRVDPHARVSDFPFKVGDSVHPGDFIGYINPFLGPAFELDMNYSVSPSTALAQHFGLPVYPSHMIEGALLDWMLGKLWEEGVRDAPSPFPQGYLFYRPTNPRYTHGPGGMKNLGTWRPFAVEWQNGNRVWLNVP